MPNLFPPSGPWRPKNPFLPKGPQVRPPTPALESGFLFTVRDVRGRKALSPVQPAEQPEPEQRPRITRPWEDPSHGSQGGAIQAPQKDVSSKGVARDEFRREQTAWRPVVVYVGSVSEEIEVSMGTCPGGCAGAKLRGVMLKARGTIDPDADNYWKVQVFENDAAGEQQLLSETTTETQSLAATIVNPLYREDGGIRIEEFHEVTAKFLKQGAPASLTQVSLQADWFAGI